MKGLAPHTLQIFEAVSQLDCNLIFWSVELPCLYKSELVRVRIWIL